MNSLPPRFSAFTPQRQHTQQRTQVYGVTDRKSQDFSPYADLPYAWSRPPDEVIIPSSNPSTRISTPDVTDRTSRKRDRHTSRHNTELPGHDPKRNKVTDKTHAIDQRGAFLKNPDKSVTSCSKIRSSTLSEDRSDGARSLLLHALRPTKLPCTKHVPVSIFSTEIRSISRTSNKPGLDSGGIVRADMTRGTHHRLPDKQTQCAVCMFSSELVGALYTCKSCRGANGEYLYCRRCRDKHSKLHHVATTFSDDENSDEQEDRNLYCYCNQPSYGEMIGCEKPECPRQWFHITCLGLKTVPDVEYWYCPECRTALEAQGWNEKRK